VSKLPCPSVFPLLDPPPDRSLVTSSPAVAPPSGCYLQQPADLGLRRTPPRLPLMEFRTPATLEPRASPLHPGLPHRVRSALRVSHPLDGLLLARTSDLVSCRYALGVRPTGVFPSRRVPWLTPWDSLMTFSPRHSPEEGCPGAPNEPRGPRKSLPPSGPFSDSRSVPRSWRCPQQTADPLLSLPL
jgi:hypothetical protein